MKKFYYYMCFEFQYLFKKATVIILIMMVLQAITFLSYINMMEVYVSSKDSLKTGLYIGFEVLSYGHYLIFNLAFICIVSMILIVKMKGKLNNKSVYTFKTLPISRNLIYISKISSYILTLVYLYTAQILSIFIAYILYKNFLTAEFQMSNALMLGIVRDDFLNMIFPFDFKSALNVIVSMSLFMLIWTSLFDSSTVKINAIFVFYFLLLMIAGLIVWIWFLRNNINIGLLHINVNLTLKIFFLLCGIWGGMKSYEKSDV